MFKIVLYMPDIPGNTGAIGRTCIALNAELILIKPYGFDLNEKSVRRAGLDYWKYVKLTEYSCWDDFISGEGPDPTRLFFFSKKGTKIYYDAKFKEGDYLIFGAETTGLPEHIFATYPQQMLSLPIYSEHVRSLNLANTATAVAYEALRQIKFT